MRKGQIGLPVIILIMLGLTIFYILWVVPEERERILSGGISEGEMYYATGIEIKPIISGEEKLILSNPGFEIKYPLVTEVIAKENVTLEANILKSDIQRYTFNANGEKITIKVKVHNKVGDPRLKLVFNDEEEYVISGDEKEISVESVNGSNTIRLECLFSGLKFWEIQKINFEIVIVKEKYVAEKEKEEINFEYSQQEGDLRLKFYVVNGKGSIKILLNDNEIYNSYVEEGVYNLTFENVELEKSNKIEIIGEKGANIEVKNFEIYFAPEESEGKRYSTTFYIPEYVLTSNYKVYLKYKISSIIDEGTIIFIFNNDENKKIEIESSIGENVIEISKGYLKKGENSLTVKSFDAHLYFEYINVTIGS